MARRLSLALMFAAIAVPASAQITTPAAQAILYDYDGGDILFCKDCDIQMPPSSMSKLMTVELVFQRLKDGRLKLDDTMHVSENAWRQGLTGEESRMFLDVNSDVRVDDLLKGIIVVSGGDACVVVAETLGGTEAGFADMENKRAVEIGLTKSHFMNSSGMPDPMHYMSALDLAKLSAHIIHDYPNYYSAYFALPDFTWGKDRRGTPIKQPNRNRLPFMNVGADGLKTGHTDAGGYGIVGSAVKDGHRLIVVVNGLGSENARNVEAARLLTLAFREFKSYSLLKPGETVGDAPVWGGAKGTVALGVADELKVTMQADARRDMKVTMRYDGPVKAPVARGTKVGTLTVSVPGKPDHIVPLVATEDVGSSGIFGKVWLGMRALIGSKS